VLKNLRKTLRLRVASTGMCESVDSFLTILTDSTDTTDVERRSRWFSRRTRVYKCTNPFDDIDNYIGLVIGQVSI
jgi:hypothetical protein